MTAETFTTDPHSAADPGPLHRQVLASARTLLAPNRPVGFDAIGRHAWQHLTAQQRADSIPELLVSYVTRVQYEAIQREYATIAAGPDTTTYLRDGDTATLWGALTEADDAQQHITVDRQALLNLTCEVDLLRHRLAMARGETATSDH